MTTDSASAVVLLLGSEYFNLKQTLYKDLKLLLCHSLGIQFLCRNVQNESCPGLVVNIVVYTKHS